MPVRLWVANSADADIDFLYAIEYRETRAYVARVLVSYEGYRASYPYAFSE